MSALISPCGQYRYKLERGEAPFLSFCMLNPSTADAEADDPTIRRCKGFAAREGFKGIRVTNLYAFRATKPKDLWLAEDPIGEHNIGCLLYMSATSSLIVCAWGANAFPAHVAAACRALTHNGARLVALGTNKDGSPKHPLYVRADAPLLPWSPP